MEIDPLLPRCFWCGDDPLYVAYHDEEWGVPVYDDRALFERLLLEGFQAGLSWRTILAKRENFRRAFDGFDAAKIAAYDDAKLAELMADAGIVRNRLKVRGAVQNARAALRMSEREGGLSEWLWSFVGGAPQLPSHPLTRELLPSATPEAEAMAKALKRAGFTFVGPTICYAFMQSAGMVNDHLLGCWKYAGPRH
ncbi:MAG: DNA-3-methyladenine glycosylase I [Caldilineaceae bacterium]